jgi:general secretion pathway protein G
MGWRMASGKPLKSALAQSVGFTLIELLVVLAIVSMLLTVAVPRYFQSVENAKQTLLVENLRQIREVLDKFYGDVGAYPETLEELVEKNYLKALPVDPVSQGTQQWILVRPKDGVRGKVADVHSGAPGLDRFGKPFADL